MIKVRKLVFVLSDGGNLNLGGMRFVDAVGSDFAFLD